MVMKSPAPAGFFIPPVGRLRLERFFFVQTSLQQFFLRIKRSLLQFNFRCVALQYVLTRIIKLQISIHLF
jgi:hypothetical protein